MEQANKMVWPTRANRPKAEEFNRQQQRMQTPKPRIATPLSASKRRARVCRTPPPSRTKRTGIIKIEKINKEENTSAKQPVANHLVEFLRSRLVQQEETKRVRLIPGFENEGFCTPRSSERSNRRSPPHLGRLSASRSHHQQLLQTPVSSARLRIQSPAPVNDFLLERQLM